jgi:hypothetical protein
MAGQEHAPSTRSRAHTLARTHSRTHTNIHITFWLDNIKETAYLVDLGTAGRIILTINRGDKHSEIRDHLHKI